MAIDSKGFKSDMSERKKVIVLDYASAKVTVLSPDENCAEDEGLVHDWCDQSGVRYGNINWMSWDGNVDFQCPGEPTYSTNSKSKN